MDWGMSVLEVAASRKTTRKYKPDQVPMETVRYVLEAIRESPSGSNAQPWRVVVVDDPDRSNTDQGLSPQSPSS